MFSMVRIIPGDPLSAFADPSNPDPAALDALRHELGLDQPWYTQYFVWLAGVLHGDFGRAITVPGEVSDLIAARLPLSLGLAVLGTIFGALIGIPAGVLAATRWRRLADHMVRGSTFVLMATPPFVLGTILILINSLTLRLPLVGFSRAATDPLKAIGVLILPALLIGLVLAGVIARYTRGTLLDTLGQDFVRTARAKGASPGRLVRRHALRNALIPVTTVVGIELAAFVGGTVVIETVFALPGMGTLLITGIRASDYPIIQATVLLIGAVYVLINFVVDLIYPLIDPRVRVHTR
ncbi:ABC-type dipeptide/oligopeptide/nickel transport system permease component [Saccharopolyspora phatthalungensis]|uniref:ABC-type dipeptide/oligopeptide/nickel transport system permease component n=1 Tax=Saccharopolyspora phatthalungensis TaxID=664693 RepID=A0A840PZ14_9PSEU|nr:ABC-type dipeptide/oligopeptide/nickel transport system permease component [Saccharopolyspora phatthalungensis]